MSPTTSTKTDDKAWLNYPTQLEQWDPWAFDDTACIEHLDRLEDVTFSKNTEVDVVERESSNLRNYSIKNEDDLEGLLSKPDGTDLRILSISQDHSLSPLNISKSGILKISSRYNVSPEFLNVVCCFGDKKLSSDEVTESGEYNSWDDLIYEISYQFRYMEPNNRAHGDRWSLRQTGVHHQYSKSSTGETRHLWIFIHPMRNSTVAKRLEKSTAEETGAKGTNSDPFRMHLLIFSSYVDNWRLYIHDLNRQFLTLEDKLMTSELRDRDLNFETLQTLSHLASKLIGIPPILRASIKTIKSIKGNCELLKAEGLAPLSSKPAWKSTVYYLRAIEGRLQSYLEACLVLHARSENVKKFLADGLNLQNQDIAAESNGHLVTLTKDTVDDSTTVRTVTLVTLIYLPATFISGLLGSNLFAFEETTSNFRISRQFWIYVLATVPLTLLTLAYWKYRVYKQQQQKKQEVEQRKLDAV